MASTSTRPPASRSLTELVSNMVEIDLSDHDNRKIHSHLYMFALEVWKIFPQCKFGYVGNSHSDRCFVYHPNKSYVMGWIGFGNFQKNGKGSPTYAVFSRRIQNEKYSYGNEARMKTSKNIKVALTNVKAFLCDWTGSEVAAWSRRQTRNHWFGTDNNLRESFNNAFSSLHREDRIKNALVDELVKLAHTPDYTFVDAQLNEAVRKLAEVCDQRLEAAKERSANMFTVSVEPHHRTGENEYVVVDLGDISLIHSDYTNELPYATTTYTEQELPEDIMRQLSVLAMCEPDQWVDNVGYKLDDKVYHVVT